MEESGKRSTRCKACGRINGHELRCEVLRAGHGHAPSQPFGDPNAQPTRHQKAIVAEIAGMTEDELDECAPVLVRYAVDKLIAKGQPS